MENVLFNYVVDGVVVEGPMSYATVLQRTGLKDTVGFTELGYIEHMPPAEPLIITQEQIFNAVRNYRNYLLQQSDWTQLPDAPLSIEQKVQWVSYRQQLRDIPADNADVQGIDEIIWPTLPDSNELA